MRTLMGRAVNCGGGIPLLTVIACLPWALIVALVAWLCSGCAQVQAGLRSLPPGRFALEVQPPLIPLGLRLSYEAGLCTGTASKVVTPEPGAKPEVRPDPSTPDTSWEPGAGVERMQCQTTTTVIRERAPPPDHGPRPLAPPWPEPYGDLPPGRDP